MKNNHTLISILLLLSCLVLRSAIADTATASDTTASDSTAVSDTATTSKQTTTDDAMATTVVAPVEVEYSRKGADTCLKCHDEDSEYPVLDIFKTRHGVKADPRTPFATLQCEACHGPAVKGMPFLEDAKTAANNMGSHAGKVRPGEKRPRILNFGDKSEEPVAEQNRMCLACHKGGEQISWQGSVHDKGQVACASCHTIHTPHDPVTDKVSQGEVCYKCHQQQRADFFKPSNHPVRFGQLGCSDCHAVHGSSTPALLVKPTLNQTCYTCHADKRGPFLWEHEPASEDCSLCHTPHGSINPSLLTKRAPLLCQQCHSQAGHPSLALTPAGLPGGTKPSGFLLAGSCTNCHSQVHGSNHPSGVKLMR
jgi:DmsE family decaheme c-type cytochrome